MPQGLINTVFTLSFLHVATQMQIYQLSLRGYERSASVSWPVGSQIFLKKERVQDLKGMRGGSDRPEWKG